MKGFLPSPPLPPSFIFLAFAPFSAQAKYRKSRSSVFLCYQPAQKRLLRRLLVSQQSPLTIIRSLGGMEGQIVSRSSLAVTNVVSVMKSCKGNFVLQSELCTTTTLRTGKWSLYTPVRWPFLGGRYMQGCNVTSVLGRMQHFYFYKMLAFEQIFKYCM